jgi:hypothetical protein
VAKLRIRLDRNLVCELLLPSGTYAQNCMSIALSWFSKMAAIFEIRQVWSEHSQYTTGFNIAYNFGHILGAFSYISTIHDAMSLKVQYDLHVLGV